MTKKSFIKNIVFDSILLIGVLPIAIFSFNTFASNQYNEFFVIGGSMQPTLYGDTEKSTYGRTDPSEEAINKIKHFDIVVCYYPFKNSSDYSQPYIQGHSTLLETASLKVKRVIGLPGDTISIANEEFTITSSSGEVVKYGGENQEVPFERKSPIINRKVENMTLGEAEYFVMGDNWTANGSLDCANTGDQEKPISPIYKENICGVVLSLDGYCTITTSTVCSSCKKKFNTNRNKCLFCGNTTYSNIQDIGERSPFESGSIYLL